ncbi:MAG: hypothetical protein RSE18_01125 [Acinetobacter sp.]
MKAIEFIKKFGWIDASHKNVWFHFGCSSERSFESIHGFRIIEDLKPYIDAWELVQSYGGLDKSKELSCSNNVIFNVHPLRKAITLVEEVGECNE